SRRDLVNLPPVRTWWSQTRSQQLHANHLVERREMRKGGRIPQRDKLRVVEGGLKGLDRVPFCHINKAKPGVGNQAPVEPSRDVPWLSFHKGFRRFPLCQKCLVLVFGHFKGIDENHRWHRYSPSHPYYGHP